MKGNRGERSSHGVKALNLDDSKAYLEIVRKGTLPPKIGKFYTTIMWVLLSKKTEDRTFFHTGPTQDDACQYVSKAGKLGYYDKTSAGGGFLATTTDYNLQQHNGTWIMLVSTATGIAGSRSQGSTEFQLGQIDRDNKPHAPKVIGAVARACLGQPFWRVGSGPTSTTDDTNLLGNGPGYLAQVWHWNRPLRAAEILDIFDRTHVRYVEHAGGAGGGGAKFAPITSLRMADDGTCVCGVPAEDNPASPVVAPELVSFESMRYGCIVRELIIFCTKRKQKNCPAELFLCSTIAVV